MEKEEELKLVTAQWSVELVVDCPHCDNYMDLIPQWRKKEYPFDIEPHTRAELEDIIFTCDKCNQEFELEEAIF